MSENDVYINQLTMEIENVKKVINQLELLHGNVPTITVNKKLKESISEKDLPNILFECVNGLEMKLGYLDNELGHAKLRRLWDAAGGKQLGVKE